MRGEGKPKGWGMRGVVDRSMRSTFPLWSPGALSSMVKKKVYRGILSYLPTKGAGVEPEEVRIEMQDPETASKSSSEGSDKEKSSEDSPLPRRYPAQQAEGDGARPASFGQSPPANLPPTDLLVPLDQPVPDTWTTKEDNFLSINPIMIPYLSSDFFGDRELSIGSGSIRIMWIDGNITRRRVFNMMTSAESGKHTELDEVYRIDVKAFRLEPLSPPGIMTVDGEVVPYGTMQAQVHPQLARVMTRRRKS